MVRINRKKAVSPWPTVYQMKQFAKKFKKSQWDQCAEIPEFLEAVCTNLDKAQNLAIQILNYRYEIPD